MGVILEADLVAHSMARRAFEFVRKPRCQAAGGDAARLRTSDQPRRAAPKRKADLGQLRGLARTGFAANNHDLMFCNKLCDFRPVLCNRQIIRKCRLRQAPGTHGAARTRALNGFIETGCKLVVGLVRALEGGEFVRRRGQTRHVRGHAVRKQCRKGCFQMRGDSERKKLFYDRSELRCLFDRRQGNDDGDAQRLALFGKDRRNVASAGHVRA